MVEEVKVLEHHAHLLTQLVDGVAFDQDIFSVDEDLTCGGGIEQVEGAQQGAFPTPRVTYNGDNFALMDFAADVS
jgi:hypothetical protein